MLDVLLIIKLEQWVFGRKTTKVKCYFHSIISRVHVINMTYHWGWDSIWQACPCSSYFIQGKQVRMCKPHLRGGDLCPTSLLGKYLYKSFEILLRERSVSSSLFIYLFNHVFISIWAHGYLFFTFSYNLVLCYLLFCSNHFSFSHWELF